MPVEYQTKLQALIETLRNCLTAIGAVWAVHNALVLTVPKWKLTLEGYYPLFLGGALLVAVAFSLYTHRRLSEVHLATFNNGDKLEISFGDVRKRFSQDTNTNFVIPVNDFFDIELGDVISARSVHGQFLEWCHETLGAASLAPMVNAKLKAFRSQNVPAKKKGRQARYDSKARVCLPIANNYFYLLPTAQMDPATFGTSMSWTDYPDTIDRVCEFLRTQGNGRHTIIPLLGDGMSKLGLPSEVLLQHLIVSIWRSAHPNVIGGSVEIVLFEANPNKFNLRRLKEWSKTVGLS